MDKGLTQTALAVVALIVLAVLVVKIAQWIIDFTKELKYLNTEINRTYGEEHLYWVNRKRRLWLSILPFFRY